MSGFLLDTHIAIFALQSPEQLPDRVREALLSGTCLMSVVSYWEVMIKSMKGMMDIGELRQWWPDALDQLVAKPLSLLPRHVSALAGLPAHHKDPFDRILIAQAIAENLTLVTADTKVMRYASAGLHLLA